ncbi:hypothetical protein [Lacrimispora sp.]|uniref:hypothetical protein n=1 Tax=Lacrimispora sp. TaxID=2719234 RepID=UPI002FDB5187
MNCIVEFNLETTQENAVWLFLTYWGEILIILVVWDWLTLKIYVEADYLLYRISADLLKKKRIRLSILCIRLKYSIRKLMFILRLGWGRSGSGDNNKIVWNSIARPPIKDTILGICFSLIKLPALIAIFLTAISLKYFELNDIQNKLKILSSFEFDFWEAIKLLSPLTVVVLMVFLGYFISFRGSIRRSIAQANRKKVEDIIQKQRELVEAIGCSFNSISSNLQYVINCQDLVADLWIHNRFPEYNNKQYSLNRDWDIENYCFENILELERISQKFNELNSNGNWKAAMVFSAYKYEVLTLVAKSSWLDLKKLNEAFFTKEGVETLIAADECLIIKYSNEEIQKMRKNYLDGMSKRIVESLELLYMLHRYYTEMNKLLDFKSDKVGRALRMLTGKE